MIADVADVPRLGESGDGGLFCARQRPDRFVPLDEGGGLKGLADDHQIRHTPSVPTMIEVVDGEPCSFIVMDVEAMKIRVNQSVRPYRFGDSLDLA